MTFQNHQPNGRCDKVEDGVKRGNRLVGFKMSYFSNLQNNQATYGPMNTLLVMVQGLGGSLCTCGALQNTLHYLHCQATSIGMISLKNIKTHLSLSPNHIILCF